MKSIANIFITGSNRGLGKELVKLIHLSDPGTQIHISSRKTAAELSNEWTREIPNHHFTAYQMNINDYQSIAQNARLAKERNIQFDSIVANAGVGFDAGETIPSEEIARNTISTNFSSTISFVKQFLPLLSDNGRVVLVSALFGSLQVQPKAVREKLSNPAITEEELLWIANDYIASAIKKDMGSYHWSAYKTSKALLNTWARFILPSYLKDNQSSINLHPGWCRTDMGGKDAPLTAQQGAKRILNGIMLDQTEKGKFYNQRFCDYTTCY